MHSCISLPLEEVSEEVSLVFSKGINWDLKCWTRHFDEIHRKIRKQTKTVQTRIHIGTSMKNSVFDFPVVASRVDIVAREGYRRIFGGAGLCSRWWRWWICWRTVTAKYHECWGDAFYRVLSEIYVLHIIGNNTRNLETLKVVKLLCLKSTDFTHVHGFINILLYGTLSRFNLEQSSKLIICLSKHRSANDAPTSGKNRTNIFNVLPSP
jgi:hypothetical protein